MRVRPGDIIRIRDLVSVNGDPIAVPDPTQLTHLQFRRVVGCPSCTVYLKSVAARQCEIAAAGIHEVVLFHTTLDELPNYAADLPLDVVTDPDRQLYTIFGVDASLRGLLDPRVVPPALKAQPPRTGARLAPPCRPIQPTGGRLGLPADILIDRGGRVLARKYGTYACDQWSVDELLQFAAAPLKGR